MSTATTALTETVRAIETELSRLGVAPTHSHPEGICCYPDDSLPAGWVRISDGTGESFGLVTEVLATLQDVPATGEVSEDGEDLDFTATWNALGDAGFEDQAPESTRDWPSDLYSTEQLEDGTCNDNPNTLVTVQTNAGVRYAAGPHGVSNCALSDWLDNLGDLAETREEAIDQGCEFTDTGDTDETEDE